MLNAWHLPVAPFVKQNKDKLSITLWLSGENPPQGVTLRAEHDNEETSLVMRKLRSQPYPGITAWRAVVDLSGGQPRRRYSFKLLWHDRQRWFTPQGFSPFPPARLEQFAVDVPDNGPQWVADQIFYQIFPDRFARSEPREEQQDKVYFHHAAGREVILRDWDDPLSAQAGGSTFYGGDLDGISEKLPYLKKLGVTALYLNPVFVAPSVHKYDTEDYRHVDPQFGGDAALMRLRHNTRQRGMRLVLDGVFNHSGDSHAWFDRHNRGTGGACHNPESPWRDWYSFSAEGVALDWLGYPSLPKLDYQSDGLVNEIYRGEDSIVRHWLKAPWNMDGWRLDVVHMLGEGGGARNNLRHVAGITQAVKETQPQAYIVGEHFGDARQWLQADAEDAAMNYRGFTFPLWGFLANTDISYDPQQIDAQSCMAWMDNYRAGLSHQQQLRMFNQLDSHDTARFKSLLGKDVARLPLAVVWLFSWPGVPCIYYGDEVGLDGNNDPFCRKTFPWQAEKQDAALFALYQRMAKLRQRSQELRYGGCQVIYAEDNVVVFLRVYNQQRVLVAINRGEACEVVLPASPLLNVKTWQLKEGKADLQDGVLTLPAISAAVWFGH
ncbi:maltodextrin glucosidase [Citrobacter rodentium]|uniref:Maltodextrin glucosidase n=2 Tax=Citrobacter rodentium TaxID=67825 RepID=D2TKY6_CITRI|nr:maltodextrin glucosidase [Citrobacter rodentium]KIQ53175.1 maltodextrin glucosidase [Citrobacter rodentium]QBY31673.1 maltodextrin glucosidase [Citrobacter rodentium]UHO30969.1 maltodextrin glucosidase [Citrobacter rodentium NBRC 105723 = DSM 16636]CBG87227.1 maltodextrin glucosidase [Citrobacter rodentium ICC168]HAT8012903.1 maltodextrin glucosidase [Citrobacter rodentium NBRC 105723 = DSM 16636]